MNGVRSGACVAAVVATLVAGFAAHVILARHLDGFVDPDEAVVALMARHIRREGAHPVFYYGQPYLGALEAYVVAGAGPRAAAVGISLLLAVSAAALAAGSEAPAVVLAAALVSLPPPDVLVWNLKIRGGFTLAALLLVLAAASAAAALRRPSSTAVAVFGLFAGLAFWTNQLTWPALAVFALAVFARVRHRLAFGLAFAAGSAPFWGYNLAHPLATFRYLAVHFAESGQIAAHTRTLLADGLPRLFGGPTLADVTGIAPLRWLGIALALAVLVPLAAARVLPIAKALRARQTPEFEDLLLLAVAASIPFRRNAEFNQLLHLAPLVVVLVAVAPARLSRRWLYVFPVALASLGAAEVVRWLPGFYRDAAAPRELVAFLEGHGVRAAYAEHRPAYLIAWHSEERIATSPALSYGYFVDRYPPYTERVRITPAPAFVFEADSVNERRFRDQLAALGVPREAATVAGYHVYLGPGLPRPPVYAVQSVPGIPEAG